MDEFKRKGYYPAGGRAQTSSAGNITYINTNSGLAAGNVQNAIDEIDGKVNKGEIYSTDEVIIGTWIDDKPIYRKVITDLDVSLTSGSWANIVDVSALDIDTLVSCVLYRLNVGTLDFKQIINPFEVQISSGYIKAWDNSNDGSISKCIIEYTKTTD